MSDNVLPLNSRTPDGELLVRGAPLPSLIATSSFLDVVFVLLRGNAPTVPERAMLDAMLVACCDHGQEPPSTAAVRTSVSTGNALHTALASGLLAMGPRHGCAIEAAMVFFARNTAPDLAVRDALAEGRRISGFGHKVYTEADPRVRALLDRARELGYFGSYVARAIAIERALAVAKGLRLPLNIDGCIAALLLELRFPSAVGNAIFMLGRLPGLVAHGVEEQLTGTTYRRATTPIPYV